MGLKHESRSEQGAPISIDIHRIKLEQMLCVCVCVRLHYGKGSICFCPIDFRRIRIVSHKFRYTLLTMVWCRHKIGDA